MSMMFSRLFRVIAVGTIAPLALGIAIISLLGSLLATSSYGVERRRGDVGVVFKTLKYCLNQAGYWGII